MMMFHWAVLLAMDWLRKLTCAATACSLDCDPGGKGASNRLSGKRAGQLQWMERGRTAPPLVRPLRSRSARAVCSPARMLCGAVRHDASLPWCTACAQ